MRDCKWNSRRKRDEVLRSRHTKPSMRISFQGRDVQDVPLTFACRATSRVESIAPSRGRWQIRAKFGERAKKGEQSNSFVANLMKQSTNHSSNQKVIVLLRGRLLARREAATRAST